MKNIETTSWLSKIRPANAKGNTVVEMSLLMLPFLILIMGVMEFGWFYFHQHTIQFATREGMRLALVGEVLPDGEGGELTREESIELIIREKASWALDPNDLNFYQGKIGDNYDDPGSFSDPNEAPSAGNPADYMRIRVTYPHKFFNPFLGSLFPELPPAEPEELIPDPCAGEKNCVSLIAEATYRNEDFDPEEV